MRRAPWLSFPSLALLLFSASTPPLSAAHGDEDPPAVFQWRGNPSTLKDLPEALYFAAFDPVDIWWSWAEKNEYQLLLSDDGNALLVVSEKRADDRRETLEECLEFFEEHFLESAQLDSEQSQRPEDSFAGVLDQAITLIEFRSEAHLDGALKHFLSEYPQYGSRLDELASQSGFLLPHAFLGGWLENAPGVKYWRPDHELINRGTLLLLSAHYGFPPLWLRLGSAWFAEFELKKRLHCFPYRDEWVSVVENAGYESHLKAEFKKRVKDEEFLSLEELEGCRPNESGFTSNCAAISWGFVTFLGRYYEDALPRILKDLYGYQLEHRRGGRHGDEGMAPPEVQWQIVQDHTSNAAFEEASNFFKTGKRYKLPKR